MNTAVVGAPSDNSNTGAVFIFTRSGGIWSQEGAKLAGAGATGAAKQGSSVAISADGNTIIEGGTADNSNYGAAWIFTRTAGVWMQQGGKLTGSSITSTTYFGCSVALSADGNTAAIGGWYLGSGGGGAWVFTRTGGVWTEQSGRLQGTGSVMGIAGQGYSVALSADGNTALIGGGIQPNEMIQVELTNVTGQILYQAKEVMSGAGKQLQSQLAALHPGVYTLVIRRQGEQQAIPLILQ